MPGEILQSVVYNIRLMLRYCTTATHGISTIESINQQSNSHSHLHSKSKDCASMAPVISRQDDCNEFVVKLYPRPKSGTPSIRLSKSLDIVDARPVTPLTRNVERESAMTFTIIDTRIATMFLIVVFQMM